MFQLARDLLRYLNVADLKMVVPWAKPWINKEDVLSVSLAVESGWISGGSKITAFENQLEERLHIDKFITCSNGTAALHLAYLALGLRPGDEIILPGYGFLAAANVASLMGIRTRFADVLPHNYAIDPNSAEKLITAKTKALVAIHTYGFVGDMDALSSLCRQYKLILIEDCSEAIFSANQDIVAGRTGDISTYSFHATKTITTGEGGAVSTNNPEVASKISLLKSHGMNRQGDYFNDTAGLNYRLTNYQAALGLSQLERIETIIELTKKNYSIYCSRFNEITKYRATIQFMPNESLPWSFPIRLEGQSDSINLIRKELAESGVETRTGFVHPNKLSYLGSTDSIPVSEYLSSEIINLPFFSTMTLSEIDFVADKFLECLRWIIND